MAKLSSATHLPLHMPFALPPGAITLPGRGRVALSITDSLRHDVRGSSDRIRRKRLRKMRKASRRANRR